MQPCWLRWRSSFVAVHLQGILQHRLQRNHQPFTRWFLGMHAWHLFHPADPPVAVLLHKSGVSAHARSLAWIKSFQHTLNAGNRSGGGSEAKIDCGAEALTYFLVI